MTICVYITHPEVLIDPDIPVPQWGLSEVGQARADKLATRANFSPDTLFVSSTERKALELANILASGEMARVISDEGLGENDRSATGFLPPDQFEIMADRFFATPDESTEGWETARAAQTRIVEAVTRFLALYPDRPLVFCGHGAVGTLLKCHVGGRAIARSEDQPAGGGNFFRFDLARRALLCDWTPIEHF